ncbi:sigma-70 family RNA polymerase sigma factor [bacterium]|nr:sigma-70 family RNA polymerase sigma factor [candidate division CSSED10-310 bacterium]
MVCRALEMKSGSIDEAATGDGLPDNHILLTVRQGNRDAFGVLVDRYRERSLRVALSIVGDRETARDLSQEAFIKAYRSIGMFDLNSPFLPWFYKILRNVCLDYLRSKARFHGMIDRFRLRNRMASDLREEIQRDDLAVLVRTAVRSLDPKDREIIELKHFAGFSYDEIARCLNIPKGTVMSRLFYARKALKRKLENSVDFLAGDKE